MDIGVDDTVYKVISCFQSGVGAMMWVLSNHIMSPTPIKQNRAVPLTMESIAAKYGLYVIFI